MNSIQWLDNLLLFAFAKRVPLGLSVRPWRIRCWSAIARFYDNCKRKIKGKKGFPKFKKNCRSVEYKSTGWKLSETRKSITFSDKKGIGTLKLKGTYDLNYYDIKQIKRVRLVRRAVRVREASPFGTQRARSALAIMLNLRLILMSKLKLNPQIKSWVLIWD
jgi:transposase